jgi:hypothetical protein
LKIDTSKVGLQLKSGRVMCSVDVGSRLVWLKSVNMVKYHQLMFISRVQHNKKIAFININIRDRWNNRVFSLNVTLAGRK